MNGGCAQRFCYAVVPVPILSFLSILVDGRNDVIRTTGEFLSCRKGIGERMRRGASDQWDEGAVSVDKRPKGWTNEENGDVDQVK